MCVYVYLCVCICVCVCMCVPGSSDKIGYWLWCRILCLATTTQKGAMLFGFILLKRLFDVDHYKVFIKFVTILLLFWFFSPKACGILAPLLGIKPSPSALESEV